MKFLEKLIVLASLSTLALLPACGSKEKASEKLAERQIENATGADVDIQKDGQRIVIESDGERAVMEAGAKSWPDAIPNEVPEFKGGKIANTMHAETTEGDGWTVIYEDVTLADLDAYNLKLKAAGFKTTLMKIGPGGTVGGEKGKLTVSCTVGDNRGIVGVQLNNKVAQ